MPEDVPFWINLAARNIRLYLAASSVQKPTSESEGTQISIFTLFIAANRVGRLPAIHLDNRLNHASIYIN